MPHLYLSFLPSHHYVAIGQYVPEGSIQSGRCSSLVLGLPRFLIHRNFAADGTAEFHGSPSEVVGKEPRAMPLVRAADVNVPDAFSFCASYPSSCWHIWNRTTAFLLVVQPLIQHRASGTSHRSHHSRSWDSHHQACCIQGRSRSDCPTHLGSHKC